MDPHAASYRGFSKCKDMTNFSENEILSREKSSRDVFSAIHEAIGAICPWSARFDSDVCDFSAPRGPEADMRIIIIGA